MLLISLVIVSLRRTRVVVTNINMCDVNAGELCVVTLGVDDQDNLIVSFQLPSADYPLFYLKASNKGNVNTYPCEVITDTPTSVFCSGIRTPLGEYIDMEVYTSEGDALLARGKLLVTALMRVTPVTSFGTPTSTPAPTPTATSTPLPATAYPNP